MQWTRKPDGSVELGESPTVLRGALLVGAVGIPWAARVGGSDPTGVVLSFVGGALFLAAALLVESRWYRFDETNRVITWRRSRLLSSRHGTLPFGAVSAVVAQPRMDDDNPRTRRVTYRPVMLTEIGEMPLSNMTSLEEEDFAVLIAAVRQVLGLPALGRGDPIVDLVRAGRLSDATSLLRRRLGVSLVEARRRVEGIRSRVASESPNDATRGDEA